MSKARYRYQVLLEADSAGALSELVQTLANELATAPTDRYVSPEEVKAAAEAAIKKERLVISTIPTEKEVRAAVGKKYKALVDGGTPNPVAESQIVKLMEVRGGSTVPDIHVADRNQFLKELAAL